jgi:hypothetical protein
LMETQVSEVASGHERITKVIASDSVDLFTTWAFQRRDFDVSRLEGEWTTHFR